jgi:hypothetical protein
MEENMSYFYDAFEDFIIKNRVVQNDGYGGTVATYEDGAVIKASLDLGTSAEIRQAEAQALKTVYTATFPIDTPVRYNDIIEHAVTGAIYRITGDPLSNATPKDAKYPSCFATAVRTELPR